MSLGQLLGMDGPTLSRTLEGSLPSVGIGKVEMGQWAKMSSGMLKTAETPPREASSW